MAATAAYNDSAHPMRCIVDSWLKLIDKALEVKKERFGQYAQEASNFYDGSHDFMWSAQYSKAPGGFLSPDNPTDYSPTFRMTVNKVFEAVALFGPALFFKYPDITVTPISPPGIDPQYLGVPPDAPEYAMLAQQQQQSAALHGTIAELKEHYLNWLQVEGGKKNESRRAINEAIVKGLGLLKTEMYQPPGSQMQYPWSRFISCDDLVKDPDAEYEYDVQWIGIYNPGAPVNLVERKYGLPEGSLKGYLQSYASQSTPAGLRDAQKGKTDARSFDLIPYWEIYSKNGFGDRLKTSNYNATESTYDFSVTGDYCHLVLAKGVPYPLNAPSELLQNVDEFVRRVQWPIPFWTDGGWPVAELGFYDKARSVWPISLIKPAIGELRFVNWCMSFLADKTASVCTDYLGVMKRAAEDIKKQLLNQNGPFKTIEIADIMGKSVTEVVSFIQAPDFPESIWKMVAQVLELIDKRTGLTELIYGLTGTQIRSATEADIRSGNVSIRPDEMASRVEDWLSETCVNEMLALCYVCQPEDVVGPLGQMGAAFFEQHIMTQDVDSIVRDFDYRVVAGSARKPNKARKAESLNQLGQVILPLLQELAINGQPEPWNAYISDTAEANDLDGSRYLVQPPDPNQPQPPSPEETDAQAKQQEMGQRQQEHEQSLQHDQESHDAELAHEKEKAQQDNKLAQSKNRMQTMLAKHKLAQQKRQAAKNGSRT